MKTFDLDDAGVQRIVDGFRNTFKNGHQFFSLLGNKFHQDTLLAFRLDGARSGHEPWRPLKESTKMTKAGTFNIRYGTDLRGASEKGKSRIDARRRGLLSSTGSLVGPHRMGVRRFTEDSIPLNASGSFMRSFRIQTLSDTGVSYGTTYHAKNSDADSERIMGDRPVLFVTQQDYKDIGTMLKTFVDKGIVF